MGLFHQYDIRGIYGEELNEDFAYKLGIAILKYTHAKKIVIGYDSRNSNLQLFSAISKAIIEQGLNVTHIGIITRPMLNWIAKTHNYDLGIIITASHNSREYNGFKFLWKGEPLYYDDGLNDVEILIKNAVLKNKKVKKIGKIVSIDYIDEYVKFLSKHLSKDFKKYIKNNTLRIIADSSNGAAGEIIKRFLLVNDITYELLYSHPDGNFPGHDPNPLNAKAPIVLSRKIPEFKADFGFIVDPDADRIRFVDDKGNVVDNNYIDCMIVEFLLKTNKKKNNKSAIVHDLISRKILSETIKKNGGVSVVSKVGTSNIINCMVREKAIFGCEMSGHRYFKIMNNQDSGLMTLVFLLNTICSKFNSSKKLSSLWKKYDTYVDLGEINYTLKDDTIAEKKINAILKYYSINKKKLNVLNIYTIDGVSIVTRNYWFNVRSSNTEPLLRLRIEGKDKNILLDVKKELEKIIYG
ncbi:MAG: hypothetical protein ACP5N1_05285 [Candidatus Woesearchaeota archaeon]